MSRGREPVELELFWKGETAAAYMVAEDDDPDSPDIWLPKSQVEPEEGAELGSAVTFLVPEWLAIEKGLV